jgi:hypothetical protein
MQKTDNEIFYNWTNSNNSNDQLQLRTIKSRIAPMLAKQVFAHSEIEEILVAEGYKQNLIKEALKMADKENEVEEPVKTAEEAIIPKRYSDLSHRFEKLLETKGPTKFVNTLTKGENPLMKLSRKELETFQKIADTAYTNTVHHATLHAFMKPSIISELAENVCRARKISKNCRVAKVAENVYQISHNDKKIEVSLGPVKSSSTKFASSSYGELGFPDEYVILAYEESSPYSQIKKDLGL